MKNYKNIALKENSTIKEAYRVIDNGAMSIAVVINDDGTLLGTLTDGDIRRGLLGDLELSDTIESLIFRTPTVCHIEDTKEKILEIAVEKKLYQVPIVDNDGKIVGIEEVDELLKPTIKKNKVILMVGGLGTRLRPLTEKTPKPMLKIGNKPILETIIMNFKKYGFTNIILSVSYKSEVIESHFGDGSKFGVNIEYIHEDKRMGTAGALSLLECDLDEPFFVMNGDILTNINFSHLLDFHSFNNSKATMCVREYDFQVPYGVIEVDDQQITSIVEKPIHKFFVNAGIYILSPQTLSNIPNDTFYDMPTLFDALIEKEEKVLSFPISEYWLDIGRLSDFEQAQSEYASVFN
ncbi:nucleotidyltransferase family protein [Sulfurimonas sp.]|uniref:nucleotidyltransferase family protein n=1 Tax=Sulfurimonas sp. TaxID=2022749 RepID=UPI0035630C99